MLVVRPMENKMWTPIWLYRSISKSLWIFFLIQNYTQRQRETIHMWISCDILYEINNTTYNKQIDEEHDYKIRKI